MQNIVRILMPLEAATFAIASLVHFSVLPVNGYEDPAAGAAEAVLAVVLIAGAALATFQSASARAIAIAVQAFALLGTVVGLTLTVAIGPTKPGDVIYHVAILIVLAWALRAATRAPRPGDS